MDADGSGGISSEEFAEAKSHMSKKKGWWKGKDHKCDDS